MPLSELLNITTQSCFKRQLPACMAGEGAVRSAGAPESRATIARSISSFDARVGCEFEIDE